MATMANGASIIQVGSNKVFYGTASAAGVISGTMTQFPILKDLKLSDKTEVKNVTDVENAQWPLDGARTVQLEFTGLQRDKNSIDLMVKTLKGSYVSIYAELNSQTVNSKYQYLFAPICRPQSSVEVTLPGNEIKYTFDVLVNSSDVGFATSLMSTSSMRATLTGTQTCTANTYYQITEV